MRRHHLSVIASLASLLFMSACSGSTSHASSFVPSVTGGSQSRSGSAATSAKLTIVVPASSRSSASARRAPQYVSPSTTQLLVAVNDATPATYALTSSAPGCALTAGNLSCTFSIVAPPGNDSLRLTLSDAQNRPLSTNVVAVAIVSGAATPVNVTLDGVVASVIAVPASGNTVDGTSAPYHVPGLFPQPIEIEALDASGNVIVGPGSPTVSAAVSASDAKYATLVSAKTTDPNLFVLRAAAGAGGHTIAIATAAQGAMLADGTLQPTVAGTTSYLYTPALAVASGPFFTAYSVETGNRIVSILVCQGGCALTIANGIAADAQGNLFVSYTELLGLSAASAVGEYPAGAIAPATTLGSGNGVTGVTGITVDSKGMLYVANKAHANFGPGGFRPPTPASITEYAPGATQPTYTISNSATDGIIEPGGIAVDGSGRVYLANASDGNFGNGNVTVYAPGNQSAPSRTIADPSLATPIDVAVTKAGLLYVSDDGNGNIAYVQPGASAPAGTLELPATIAGGRLMLDATGDLWISDSNAQMVERIAGSGLPGSVNVVQTLNAYGATAWIP